MSEHNTSPPCKTIQLSTLPFPVVGIGASAGGISAVIRLLQHVPRDSGMAFVVVLHLSSNHESHAPEIFQHATPMKVVQVRETTAIEADHVYVIAPGSQLQMDDSHLVVEPGQRPRGALVTIDVFFRTLAIAHRERAIALVLSGGGSDGSVGLAEIKQEGGVTMVQKPSDAEHSSMPNAAVETGLADFILPVHEMGQKLVDLWQNARTMLLPQVPEPQPEASSSAEIEDEMAQRAIRDVLDILLQRTQNDFHHYKLGTVLRRLQRRMQITRQPSLQHYREYLVSHPQETGPLLQDMLISVTSFFRDREAFDMLDQLYGQLLAKQRPEQARAWVVGCATGEEAYSVAMMLNDHVAEMKSVSAQIFASDIDERALARARTGHYPSGAAHDISATRLRRYLEPTDNGLRVKKALREQILFTRHNVLRDAPFSRVDIISCRNLLIYLDRSIQIEVLKVFHFALNPGGLLILGSAETADAMPNHFAVVDKKHRIYRATPLAAQRRELLPLRTVSIPTAPVPELESQSSPIADLHQRVLQVHAGVSIFVDAQFKILHTSKGASHYLRYAEGQPSQGLMESLLPKLVPSLRPALLLVAREGGSAAARPVTIDGEVGPIVVRMSVYGGSLMAASGQLLIRFEEVHQDLGMGSEGVDPAVDILERELQRLGQQLQGTLGESVYSDEALRASNEELQSMNEEMRSTTEELETSKEELQSVNEELSTVNFELKHKVEEADRVNDDLSNLIASMNIATLFVDRDLRIKGFTPLASSVFSVLSSDVGRSLLDLTHRLKHEGLSEDVQHVIDTLSPIERELASADGRWYLMRVSVYRTSENRINGAVLNFIDVTERRQAQEAVRVRDERLRMVAETTRDYAMVTMDSAGAITGWNRGAELMFGYTELEVLDQHFRMLFSPEDRQAGQPEEELRQALAEGRALDERWHLRKDGSRFYCSGITSCFFEGTTHAFAKIARDLTERQRLEKQQADLLRAEQQVRKRLESATAARSEFLAVMSHELKGPLNLMLLNAEVLSRAEQIQSAAPLIRAAENIKRTVRSQARIIDDLLDLSRLNTGKLALQPSTFAVRPLIDRIIEAIQVHARTKQISVSCSGDDVTIEADPIRIEQVIWNLVSNAVKFTPPGGTVKVAVGESDGWASISVADSGKGIAPQFLPHVFDMFMQEDGSAYTRKSEGLGIGLALVKSLVELHGGEVGVTSSGLDQGACFTLRLPLLVGSRGSPQPGKPGGLPSQGVRVLLVDDDEDALELTSLLLEDSGFAVTKAGDASQAIAHAQQSDFDVIVSDIAMPVMDGRHMLRELKHLPGTANAAAIAVSGFGRPEDEQLSLQAGFDLHLKKPITIQVLVTAIGMLLERAR